MSLERWSEISLSFEFHPKSRPLTVVLVILFYQTVNIDPEMPDPAHLTDLLSREKELGHIPEVLTHSPDNLFRVNAGLVPLQKLPGCSHILGNRLLREDMFARKEGLFDKLRLNQDWQTCCSSVSLLSEYHQDE
jgi:hypothetical protein